VTLIREAPDLRRGTAIKGKESGRSAGFQTCCIADFQIGSTW
jgi:hypothetical protein